MIVCHIFWRDLGMEKETAYRHALLHLNESAQDSLKAIEMSEDYQNLREPRDLILVRFNSKFKSLNKELMSISDEVWEVWEAAP